MRRVGRGITAVEMLVTLAIILLLLSLAFPSYIKAIFKAEGTKPMLEHRDFGLDEE